MSRPTVFLDRDGVLVRDEGLVTRNEQLILMPGVGPALMSLKNAGFALVVVSNQAVIARGLVDEVAVKDINQHLAGRLLEAGGPQLDARRFCPHHPEATDLAYRVTCSCRKPAPGMIRQAATDLDLDLRNSFMVGDRLTDVEAGAAAGCRTILLKTGQHAAPRIVSAAPAGVVVEPDYVCADLPAAARWILREK